MVGLGDGVWETLKALHHDAACSLVGFEKGDISYSDLTGYMLVMKGACQSVIEEVNRAIEKELSEE